jgi:hypothetical protein
LGSTHLASREDVSRGLDGSARRSLPFTEPQPRVILLQSERGGIPCVGRIHRAKLRCASSIWTPSGRSAHDSKETADDAARQQFRATRWHAGNLSWREPRGHSSAYGHQLVLSTCGSPSGFTAHDSTSSVVPSACIPGEPSGFQDRCRGDTRGRLERHRCEHPDDEQGAVTQRSRR